MKTKKFKRVFLIVADSFGVGELPDAEAFGDSGANTFRSVLSSDKCVIPNLIQAGLLETLNEEDISEKYKKLNSEAKIKGYNAAVFKSAERSAGKDTIIGHWEICGIVSKKPLPTYPDGFPDEVIKKFESAAGCRVLCNKPYSGTEVIKDYGQMHIKTGNPIVYTSADSVFQIACHESIIPPEELYGMCRRARKILSGSHAVGRVIARPFEGIYPNFKRTERRRDFSLEPPEKTLLDIISESGDRVYAVGKISDIFAGRGITDKITSHSNQEGMKKTEDISRLDFEGICFTNLVDFDMLYGHRRDRDGYAGALSALDKWIKDFAGSLNDDDLLILTADHGCDPLYTGTDHTREYTPIVVYADGINPGFRNIRNTFADTAASAASALGLSKEYADSGLCGRSYLDEIL